MKSKFTAGQGLNWFRAAGEARTEPCAGGAGLTQEVAPVARGRSVPAGWGFLIATSRRQNPQGAAGWNSLLPLPAQEVAACYRHTAAPSCTLLEPRLFFPWMYTTVWTSQTD